MEEQNDFDVPRQMCSIQINFIVTSDDEAIKFKTEIGNVMSSAKHCRLGFNLEDIPARKLTGK